MSRDQSNDNSNLFLRCYSLNFWLRPEKHVSLDVILFCVVCHQNEVNFPRSKQLSNCDLHLFHGADNDIHFLHHIDGCRRYLFGCVQNLYCLSVRIVSQFKRSLDGFGVFPVKANAC